MMGINKYGTELIKLDSNGLEWIIFRASAKKKPTLRRMQAKRSQ